jgi:hypothetical protein
MRAFTANQVAEAAAVTPDVLTNYLAKAKILLCSETAGQGRARRFCLVDAYQLSLMSRLTALTANAGWSARSLENLLFGMPQKTIFQGRKYAGLEHEGPAPFKTKGAKEVLQRRRLFCENIAEAPELYWSVPSEASWVLFAERRYIEAGEFTLKVFRSDEPGWLRFVREGYLVNVSTLLRETDSRLRESSVVA